MIARGQFRILFFAASQTQRVPVITPHHSNGVVMLKKCIMLSLTASAIVTMRQM